MSDRVPNESGLKCTVCGDASCVIENGLALWRYSPSMDRFWCSLECFDLYKTNPLGYEDGPRLGSCIYTINKTPKYANIDND